MSLAPLSKLSSLYQKAAHAAIDAAKNGYAPYSKFHVGAALVHLDDSITSGANWEIASYQATCAERAAIWRANAAGHRKAKAVAVYGKSGDENAQVPPDTLVTPCGVCRQLLNEVAQLSGGNLDVILVATSGQKAKLTNLNTLLPDGFGPVNLGIDLHEWAVDKAVVPVSTTSTVATSKPKARRDVTSKTSSGKKPSAKKGAKKK